jgi:predicted peptidase
MRNAFVILTTLAATFSLGTVSADEGKQQSVKLDTKVPVELDYLLYLPKGYADQDQWPLLVFLHGAGERGDDLELVKKHGPPKLIEEGKDLPFVVVSPQCPNGQWWTAKPLELTALLDEVVGKHKVDKERIYLTGLSMGGFGTWTLAAYSPDRFAAIVPICGGGEVMATRALGRMPTWVFHGAKDSVVPLKRSEDMVEALKRVNKDVKFTVYPEAMHDSWTETYSNPQLYDWLLSHKRAATESAGP